MKQAGEKSKGPTSALIFDGTCPICKSTVAWIRENEIEDSFEMIPCQSESLLSRFPGVTRSACTNAMHLVLPDGRVLAGENALPEIVKRLKRYHRASMLFQLPAARTVSRFAYRWFAARRYRIAEFLAHLVPRRRHR